MSFPNSSTKESSWISKTKQYAEKNNLTMSQAMADPKHRISYHKIKAKNNGVAFYLVNTVRPRSSDRNELNLEKAKANLAKAYHRISVKNGM